MLKQLMVRLDQGHRTIAFPLGPPPELPDRFRGRPTFDTRQCPDGCRECVDACPTDAIRIENSRIQVNLGRCLFCTDCADACPQGAVSHRKDYRLAVRSAEDLTVGHEEELKLATQLEKKILRLFGRSLHLRQVSAGGCNGCESDLNVLTTIGWDLSRFGISFVASPRHADGLIVTGPVTANMKDALMAAYQGMPSPKIVIAVGACACSGGPYVDHPETHNGIGDLLPVDLYIPGCPPHPLTILDGLLRLLGRLEGN
jgi:Ni,Fe-hydrogenase III small subunit/Pyruvate/2-oxoacid:ferredoxin oxidoreductase delta subunit